MYVRRPIFQIFFVFRFKAGGLVDIHYVKL